MNTRVNAPLVSLQVRDFHRTFSLVLVSHPSSQAGWDRTSHTQLLSTSLTKDTHPSYSHSLPTLAPPLSCYRLWAACAVFPSLRFPGASGRVPLLMCYDTE